VTTGSILGEAWGLYKSHWRHLLPIALVFYLVISGIALLLGLTLGIAGALIGAALAFIGVFLLQGALTEAVADVRDGRADLSIGDTFSRVVPVLGVLIAASILAAIGIMLGLVLLIVPGLVLLTWWSLIVPAIVLEKAGVLQSFGRSRQLVRGHGWMVFGVIIVTILILIVARGLIAVVLFWLPEELRSFGSDLIGGTLTTPFSAIAWTVMYFRLRATEPAAEAATEPRVL